MSLRPRPDDLLSEAEMRFARRAVRRKRLSRGFSIGGLVVAAGLAAYYALERWRHPGLALGEPVVIVILVMLNARLNLRQYRHAAILERLGLGARGGEQR